MLKFIRYLLPSILAALFAVWFWKWGVAQGPVASIKEVPGIFGTSNIVVSVLFFGTGWLVLRKNLKKSTLILAGLLIWYLGVVLLAKQGFFAWRPLIAPNIILAFIILFVLGKKVLSQRFIQEAFNSTALNKVFLVQTFRVMGVGFLALYAMKVLPPQFAIPTGIGDVIIGTTAPIVAYIYSLNKVYSKSIALAWNYLGLADLTMSITLGLATYPEPLHLVPTQISNLPIALYPLVIIPVFAVPFSALLHIFSIRALRRR